MILELKFHVKNKNTHMYSCTNFQEHSWLGTEDTHTRVITKLSIYPLFLCIFHLSFNCAFHSTNKIDQKWPTTSHRRWCYTSWNSLIFRTDTHTYLFYTITNLYIIWYTPWYFFIILARNADTYMTHIAVSKYMLTDDIWRITYISGNYNVRAFTWYAYSW